MCKYAKGKLAVPCRRLCVRVLAPGERRAECGSVSRLCVSCAFVLLQRAALSVCFVSRNHHILHGRRRRRRWRRRRCLVHDELFAKCCSRCCVCSLFAARQSYAYVASYTLTLTHTRILFACVRACVCLLNTHFRNRTICRRRRSMNSAPARTHTQI